MAKKQPTTDNLKAQGDYWVNTRGQLILFSAMRRSSMRELLLAITEHKAGCHPEKYARLAAYARSQRVYAPFLSPVFPNEEFNNFQRQLWDASSCAERNAVRLVFADWLDEHDREEDAYAQRWLANFSLNPLRLAIAANTLFISAEELHWVWVYSRRALYASMRTVDGDDEDDGLDPEDAIEEV